MQCLQAIAPQGAKDGVLCEKKLEHKVKDWIDIVVIIICWIVFLFTRTRVDVFAWVSPISYAVLTILSLYRHKQFFLTLWLRLQGKKIRVSMSYIYIIKDEKTDKYLLVKNSHNPNYQFVGGKYKYYATAENFLRKIEYEPDNKLGTDGILKRDIAFYVPAKNFYKFLRWFDSQECREIDHFREFNEEVLTDSKTKAPLLNFDDFKGLEFQKLTTVKTPIKKSNQEGGFNCIEYLQYDVLEPSFTPEQKEKISELCDKGDTEDVKWASEEVINSLGFDIDKKEKVYGINNHTKWCLRQKYSKE